VSLLVQHLFTPEVRKARREYIEREIARIMAEYRVELKALLRLQHRALKRAHPQHGAAHE